MRTTLAGGALVLLASFAACGRVGYASRDGASRDDASRDDASLDGGVALDSERADGSHDAGGGPDAHGDGASADAGEPERTECDSALPCEWTCAEPECRYRCRPGTVCDAACPAGAVCRLDCDTGAVCSLSCGAEPELGCVGDCRLECP